MYVAYKRSQHTVYEFPVDMLSRKGSVHLVLHVVAGSGSPQLERCRIFLGIELQAFYLLGLLARTEYQHPCSQRVQGPCMSYLHAPHPHSP